MPRMSIEDLKRIREETRQTMNLRTGSARARITVHMGTCGIAAGARGIMSALLEEFERQDIKDVILTSSGCAGLCSREPMATVELKGEAPIKYVDLTPDKMRRILAEHVLGGEIIEECVLAKGSERVS